jgi:hypothetical protein
LTQARPGFPTSYPRSAGTKCAEQPFRRTQDQPAPATMPAAGSDVIVVTHRPNILDAFGKDWFHVREGESSIFSPDGAGGYNLVRAGKS